MAFKEFKVQKNFALFLFLIPMKLNLVVLFALKFIS